MVTLPSRLPAATTVSQSADPVADVAPGFPGWAVGPAGEACPHADRTSPIATATGAHAINLRATFVMLRLL
jgi:hypothetical protein